MKKRLLFIFAFITMLLCFGAVDSYAGDTDGQVKYKGMANDTVNVREGPGTKYDKVMMEDKTNLQLHAREEIVILDEAVSDEGTVWYHLVVTRDGKEYRNRLYSYDEILKIIDKYGLPQIWNPDFKYGPECYIEVQIWTDRGLERWIS